MLLFSTPYCIYVAQLVYIPIEILQPLVCCSNNIYSHIFKKNKNYCN